MRESKTVASQSGIEGLLTRLVSLQSTHKAKWGTMQVTEMLYHCNRANFSILKGSLSFSTTGFYAWAMKKIFLNLSPRLPKYVKGPKKLDPKNHTVSLDRFEHEKAVFKSTLPQFLEWTTNGMVHPYLGPMSEKEWKRFVWMHMDHHFRQFGI